MCIRDRFQIAHAGLAGVAVNDGIQCAARQGHAPLQAVVLQLLGQQMALGDTVSRVVIDALGGKESNAYKEISKKVFAECNRDLKHYFNVNARNNVPKKKFDEAVQYVKNWQPCTNTRIMIQEYNAQLSMECD